MPGPRTGRGKYTLGSPASKKRARRTTVVPSKGRGADVEAVTTTRSNAKQVRKQNRADRDTALRRVRRVAPEASEVKRGSKAEREVARSFYESKRERATNRRAELGIEEHPDAPKGFDKVVSDLVPDDPVEIALMAAPVGKVIGAGAKAVGAAQRVHRADKLLRRSITEQGKTGHASLKTLKARQAADDALRTGKTIHPTKEAAKNIAAQVGKVGKSKPARAAKAGASKAAKTKAGKGAVKVGKTTKKAYKSKPAAPIRVPLKAMSKHPKTTTAASLGGPGAVQFAQTGDTKKLTAPIEGTAKAIIENPKRTAATTLHTLPSLITMPVGLAADTALTGGRAVSAAANELGVPGARSYSGKDITDPLLGEKGAGTEIGKFAKRYAEVYGSGDPEKIQKATEEEFGVGMALPLVGALRGKARKGAVAPETGAGKVKLVRNRRKKKEVSREHARTERYANREGMALPDEIQKVTGRKGKRSLTKKTPSGRRRDQAIASAASTGATEPRHLIADAAARNRGTRNPEVPKTVTTRHDIARDARQDPGLLKDKQVQEGLAATRREQPNIEFSPVKKWEGVMVTAGIKHPWERKGYKRGEKLTDAELKHNAKLERDAVNEAKAWAAADGRVEPVYVQSVDATRPRVDSGKGSVRGASARESNVLDYQSTAKLNKAGKEDVSLETFMSRSALEPRAKGIYNEATHGFLEREAMTVPGKRGPERFVTEKEKNALINGETWTDPKTGKTVKAEDVVWIDAQSGKAAVLQGRPGKRTEVEVEVFQEPIVDAVTRRTLEAKGGLDISKGKKFFPVDAVKGAEWLRQQGRMKGGFAEGFQKVTLPSQRLASRALLGYSPSWLAAQPVAEMAQALAATGPVRMVKAHRLYKQAPPEVQRAIDARVAGGTAGTNAIYQSLTDVTKISEPWTGKGGVTKRVAAFNEALKQHPTGRVAQGILSTRYANSIDRAKGLAIRRTVAIAGMEREFTGLTKGLRNAGREMNALETRMAKMTPDQRMRFIAENPKAAAKIEGYLDDVMGNWSALTTNERALSGAVIFYPFIRMSLEWTALTYPARHPLKAAALHFLAQENAQQVENLLGGKPSFFSTWATVPLHAGEDGAPTSLLPLGRIAPGSNALIEAVGDSDNPRAGLRAVNPFVAAALAASGNYDPLTGRNLSEKYERPSWEDIGRNFAGALAKLPAPIRVVDKAIGGKLTKIISGKGDTPTAMLFDQLDGSEKREVFKALVPFVLENTARERQRQEIGRLLQRKYAAQGLDFFNDIRPAVIKATKGGKDPRGSEAEEMVVAYLDALVARNRLNKLNEQYGIPAPKDLTGRAQNIAQATSDMTLPGTWNNILEAAAGLGESDQPTGLNVRRLKKLRRARARSLMGNS